MKVLVRGPALTRTGYGEHCRFVLRALREIKGLEIFLLPVNWGHSNWIWENNEERQWIDEIVKNTAMYNQQNGQYDMSIQVTIPNEWERMAPINIGVTAGIETTKVSPQWLVKANEMDKIITISEHSKQTLLSTVYEGVNKSTGQKGFLRCSKEVDIVHYPVKQYEEVDLDLNLSTKFNFLTVAQWGPRKNIHNTISWFVEEFYDNPDVGLVVKTFSKGGSIIDRVEARRQLSKLLKKYENRKCKIYLLHGDLTEEEMHSLYTNKDINCLVSLTHGEGFGLPLFEAAYSGLPVLATDWSGHLDFLYMSVKDKKGKEKLRAHYAKVDFALQPVQKQAVWDGVVQADSMWAYPQQGSYKMKLREVYKDHGRFVSQAKKLQSWILENFTQEQQYEKLNDCIRPYLTSVVSDQEIDDLFAQLTAES
jgi:glycosyltransferase involved in cell wall biosynthesis